MDYNIFMYKNIKELEKQPANAKFKPTNSRRIKNKIKRKRTNRRNKR